MIEELIAETYTEKEAEFYSKPFKFSYSSLNKLLWNPLVFYQMYIMGIKEERLDKHLVDGKVIHAMLLENDRFNELFVISPTNLPTGLARQTLDKVFKRYEANKEYYASLHSGSQLKYFRDEIVDAMKELNYFQALKTDDQRTEKILTPENQSYWEFMMQKGDKTLIDEETYQYCKNAADMARSHPKVIELLGLNLTEFDNHQVFNEQYLEINLMDKPFGLKGIIDNLHIDHDNRVVYINDVKTSGKDLKDWPQSLEMFDYWMQAAIYTVMVVTKYADLFQKGYDIRFHFVVIDRSYQTYCFPVREETLEAWIKRLYEQLQKAQWHFDTRNYELPYDFATGQMTL